MSSTVKLSVKVNVVDGPSISIARDITVEAYDKIAVTIEASETDKEVEIQPGSSSQVQMILIKSSEYGTDLTYKVHETGADSITLDHDQVFLGQGGVGLLGTDLDKLYFTNGLPNDVNIEIFVGRDATP